MVPDKEKKTKQKITQGYIRNTEKIKFVILGGKRTLAYFRVILSYCWERNFLSAELRILCTAFLLLTAKLSSQKAVKANLYIGRSIYLNNYFNLKKFLYLVRRLILHKIKFPCFFPSPHSMLYYNSLL